MIEEKPLTLKDAIALAHSYKQELNRRVASLGRIEEVLEKAQRVDALAVRYDKVKQDLVALEEKAAAKKAELEEAIKQDAIKRRQEIHQLDFQIRERQAKVERLQERVTRLTATMAVLEDEEKPAEQVNG